MTANEVPQSAIDAGKEAYANSIANNDSSAETVAKIIAAGATAMEPGIGGGGGDGE